MSARRGLASAEPYHLRKATVATAAIRRLVATCDSGLTGLRDRALLLLGFARALRRSEQVAIQCEHLTFGGDGLRLHIPRGRRPDTCPVRALEAWLRASVWLGSDVESTGEMVRYSLELARQRTAAIEAGTDHVAWISARAQ